MKVKNVIANSSEAESLKNWLRGASEAGAITNPPTFKEMIPDYPIEELIEKNLHIFQRKLQRERLKKIAAKVLEFGFLFFPIVLDEDFKMVDGQHRATVAYIMGYKTIPAAIYSFRNHQHKAKFFAKICMPDGGGPAILDRMNSRRIANYPYESMIHRLIMDDTQSKFYDCVDWKGIVNKKQKITLPVFMKMVNWIGLGLRRKWDNGYDGYIQHVCETLGVKGYQDVRQRLNDFADWLFAWAGTSRQNKPDLYKEKIIIGFMDFYIMMIMQSSTKRELNRHKKESIKRFRVYNFTHLLALDYTGVTASICKEYNRGRQPQNKINDIELEINVPYI